MYSCFASDFLFRLLSILVLQCFFYLFYSIIFFFNVFLFFFKQKTAYEMRISDWSSDVCSSDLPASEFRSTSHIPRRGGQASTSTSVHSSDGSEIGRASCRERVCQYV